MMITFKRRFRTAFAATGFLCVAGVVAGNTPDENEDDEPGPDQNRVVEELAPEVFDQRIFPNRNPKAARDQLEMRLKIRIHELNQACKLTPAQIQKLELAGRTEIKRLFDGIEAGRRKFESQRGNPAGAAQVFKEIQPLRLSVSFASRAFEERSLFHKVARTALTEEQLPRYLQQLQERRLSRRRSQQESFLRTLQKKAPLQEEQRVKLNALLEELPLTSSGSHEVIAFWYLASNVSEEKYREILDADQWKILQTRFAAFQNMGPMLRENGVLDDDDAPLEEDR